MNEADVATLVMNKYSLLKQEIWHYFTHYKAHVRNFQIISTGLLAVVAYIIATPAAYPDSLAKWWIWWAACTFLPIIANYLVWDFMDVQYSIMLIGERMSMHEEELNRLIGKDLFFWERKGAPTFFMSFRPAKGIINPNYLVVVFGGTVFAVIAVVVPTVGCVILSRAEYDPGGWYSRPALWVVIGLTSGSAGVTVWAARKTMLGMRLRIRHLLRRIQ